MKIVVELNNEDLHKAIGNQLQEAVSRVVHEKIEGYVEKIIEVKFGRVDFVIEKVVQRMLDAHAKNNSSWNANYMDKVFAAASEKYIKDKLEQK